MADATGLVADKVIAPPLRTPLYELHASRGARLIEFADHLLPIHYARGVMDEYLHTRRASGLFDVSHMGQIWLWPKSGDVQDVALALERVVAADIMQLPVGRQRYALTTNADGGIIDDLMVANSGTHIALIVNASNKAADVIHLQKMISDVCTIEVRSDLDLLTLQGPNSEAVLTGLIPAVAGMRFMDVRSVQLSLGHCTIARSGYTGEDGFEISVEDSRAHELALMLLAHPDVELIGLGARDSLRLEAGLCLHDYDVLYRGAKGRVAHECIVDLRPITQRAGVSVDDVAKRLIDYEFHAPTVSLPVPGTLMIEPTVSESLSELDRFCAAMLAIRQEIEQIAAGEVSLGESPLRRAPHTVHDIVGKWDRRYPRLAACLPTCDAPARDKYGPPVGRIDGVLGDRNLICACPPLEEYGVAAE